MILCPINVKLIPARKPQRKDRWKMGEGRRAGFQYFRNAPIILAPVISGIEEAD